jgi:hypothetical protein
VPIAQRIDFGGIERTRTLAPVFEGAQNAFIPEHAPVRRSDRLAPVLEGVFAPCGRVESRLRTWPPRCSLRLLPMLAGIGRRMMNAWRPFRLPTLPLSREEAPNGWLGVLTTQKRNDSKKRTS